MTTKPELGVDAPDSITVQRYVRTLNYAIREVLGTAAAIASQGYQAADDQLDDGIRAILVEIHQAILNLMRNDIALMKLQQLADNGMLRDRGENV